MSKFLGQRPVIATLTVVVLSYFYWNALVESLHGSLSKAVFVVICAWVAMAVDLNEHMVGQPEATNHHHHHHHD